MARTRSQWVSLVAMFTALAIVLNLAVSVPAPYAYFLSYEVWEVPVLLALLLMGFKGGLGVAALNAAVLEAVKPGPLPTGPLYNLVAELAMFLGVMLVLPAARRYAWGTTLTAASATAAGVVARTSVMTVVNSVVLAMPYPLGFGSFGVTQAQVPGYLVLIAVFNITVTLYTVPLAFSARRAIESRSRSFLPPRGGP
jgi:riboflavin transporter FmnP